MMTRILLVLVVVSMAGRCLAASAADDQRFAVARKLADDGKLEEAFRGYLAIPGAEYAAVALARGEAGKFLALLQADRALLESPCARLVEAELLLASDRKDEAKERFQTLAGLATKDNWGTGQPGYYPVEPPGRTDADDSSGRHVFAHLALPFSYGPGSHRDNGLLRRLIAFELMDDASREFARIWEIHRARARLHQVISPQYDEKGVTAGTVKQVVRPSGFDSRGLQFALDYAFFLKRINREEEALAVLLEPLRVMDMDRDPNRTFPQPKAADDTADHPMLSANIRFMPGFTPGLVGVARREFIRLAYGEFKKVGKETVLSDELKQQIESRKNRARRVLAQVKLHQGETGEALALELAYIENGNFNPSSGAFRRGLIFESYGKTAEAVAAFEQVLAAAPSPMRLPDAEEQISENLYQQTCAYFGYQQTERSDVRERLQRLYAALGRMDKVLEFQFAQFDTNEGQLENLEQIEQMAARLKSAGQEQQFKQWAVAKLDTAKSPRARANLAWQIGDLPAAIKHAAAAYSGYYFERQQWRERFAKVNPKHDQEYLTAVVKAHPDDAVARLELLDLEDNLDGSEAMAALEGLLATDADKAFPQGRLGRNRTNIQGYFGLSYRLMRLYEKNGRLDNLRTLGLRMAKGEKPFDHFERQGYESSGENGREEFGNACLALAVSHADDAGYQSELADALETSRWVGARSQLARRVGASPALGNGGVSPPWANLPRDTRVIVSCESVACVARNERFVFVGLPWGVAVYDFKGSPATRILLGKSVTKLVAADDQIWVGTEDGLFCITAGTWAVRHGPLGKVEAMGLDGDQLWIGVGGRLNDGLMVLNRHTLALRRFSAEEIGIERTEFSHFESDGRYLWADNYYGLLRYDRSTDTWSALENPGPRDPVHLIGIIDGQVWADVWLNDELRHRPARLDRDTLRLTPLHLSGNTTRDQRMFNSDITFRGHHHGQPVFGVDGGYGGRFVVEENSNTIRRMRDSSEDGAETISDPLPAGVRLPDGRDLPIPTHAWPDGLRVGVRSTRWSERWPSDAVWAVVFDDTRKQDWLCVGAGLAVMPRDGKGLRHFGSTEGLTLGPMLDGVELGTKFYFASAWDDRRGSLTVYEPKTGGFTPRFRSDGMDSDKVVGLAVNDGQLEIRYGVDYPGDDTDNRLAPGRFDPATGQFTTGGTVQVAAVEGKRLPPATNGTLPVLGGPAYRSYERGGKTWHCGGRGLVIFPGKKAPDLTFEPMKVRYVSSPDQILHEEAKKIKIPDPIPATLLKELVKHPNRYVRARAVIAAHHPLMNREGNEYAAILLDCVNDVSPSVRAPAVWMLSQCNIPEAVPALQEALDDSDAGIRAMATVALARHGVVQPLEFFQDIIKLKGNYSRFPYGDDSSISVGADYDDVFTSLAPHADRKIFGFLVSLSPPNYHHTEPIYPVLGESLRKHPDAAGVLLALQDVERYGTWQSFVQSVFKNAGKEMLPILHEALASDNRVVRSNAARACGAIGDAASIPYLLKSLDMESGLSRASIVWALGELKAGEAIPRLIAFHQDARNAEHNRSTGSGFLAAQNASNASQGEYTALRDLDAIASDWDEMKVSTQRRPHDPRRDEELLTPEHVLAAVRKIGSAAAQEFYRALAAGTNSTDRVEAALGLAQTNIAGRERSLTILRSLLADATQEVRITACVSLHFLGEPGMDTVLLDRLREGQENERRDLLQQMNRLQGSQLESFRKEIETLSTSSQEPEYLRDLARQLGEKLIPSPAGK